LRNLEEIVGHISKDNPQVALKFGEASINEAFSLNIHPFKGSNIRGRPGAKDLSAAIT
jgi:hypothetical protein